MEKSEIVLVVHNVRSAHNVGSIFRSADAFGISKIYLTGYTPYPKSDDERLPHLAAKMHAKIAKTSLGAEEQVDWQQEPAIFEVLSRLEEAGYILAGLEQAENSVALPDYAPAGKLALVVGREVEGIEPEVLERLSVILEIPMLGQKESLNVAVAAGIAMYQLRYGT